MHIVTLLYLLFIWDTVNGANILVAVMPNGKSHAGSFAVLLQKLASRGHNVTLYMENTVPISFKGITPWYINVTECNIITSGDDIIKRFWEQHYSSDLQYCGCAVTKYRDQYLNIANYNWDLILTDSIFAYGGYGIAELSKAKHVIMHSTDVESSNGVFKGYARHFLLMPFFFMDYKDPSYNVRKFSHRLRGTYDWLVNLFDFAVRINENIKETLSPVLSDFDYVDYNAKSSMSLTDMPLSIYVPLSQNNELFSYGAYCNPYKSLDGEILEFVSDPTSKGTIVVAFGTVIRWYTAAKEKRDAFLGAFSRLSEYRIIWAYSGPELHIPKHIKIAEWVPQSDILNDNRTKLLITHGGLKSVKESICATVPTIYMPMFAEQTRNAWLASSKGVGQIINKDNITADELYNKITMVLNTPKYKENIVKLKRCYEDTPIPAVSEGVFRLERLLKYGGRMPDYFYTRSTTFSYLRYLNLDLLILLPIAAIFALIK